MALNTKLLTSILESLTTNNLNINDEVDINIKLKIKKGYCNNCILTDTSLCPNFQCMDKNICVAIESLTSKISNNDICKDNTDKSS